MKKILSTTLLFFVGFVNAGGGTGDHLVESLFQRECTSGKGFQIVLATNHNNPDSCPNAKILEVACNHPGLRQIVSLALVAYTAKKKVWASVNSCDSEGQAKVVALLIKD